LLLLLGYYTKGTQPTLITGITHFRLGHTPVHC
jgi:hypothetical protein